MEHYAGIFCRKPAFARRFVYRPLDVFVWWRWARQGAYAALWRRRKHFGIVPMRIEKSGEHRQAAGATHSAAVLVAAERDRTRGLTVDSCKLGMFPCRQRAAPYGHAGTGGRQ
jgi:hypothetical protein